MSTGNKFFIANICCIPVVIALDAPYWYYAWGVQLLCIAAQIGFDIRDIRRRKRELATENEALMNQLRKMSNGQ